MERSCTIGCSDHKEKYERNRNPPPPPQNHNFARDDVCPLTKQRNGKGWGEYFALRLSYGDELNDLLSIEDLTLLC